MLSIRQRLTVNCINSFSKVLLTTSNGQVQNLRNAGSYSGQSKAKGGQRNIYLGAVLGGIALGGAYAYNQNKGLWSGPSIDRGQKGSESSGEDFLLKERPPFRVLNIQGNASLAGVAGKPGQAFFRVIIVFPM